MFDQPVAVVSGGKAKFYAVEIDLPESCEDAPESALLHITKCGRLRVIKDI